MSARCFWFTFHLQNGPWLRYWSWRLVISYLTRFSNCHTPGMLSISHEPYQSCRQLGPLAFARSGGSKDRGWSFRAFEKLASSENENSRRATAIPAPNTRSSVTARAIARYQLVNRDVSFQCRYLL